MTPSSLPQAGDFLPERRPALRVETGRRLVEEEDSRHVDECEREVEPALHPARVARHLPVASVLEADADEELVSLNLPAILPDPLERRLQPQVISSREQRVESGLLERDADQRAHLRSFLDDVVPSDARRSGGRRQERRQDMDGGRLSRAVRPEEAVDLARRDGDVDPVDRAWALLVLANEPQNLDPVCRLFHCPRLPAAPRSYAGSRGASRRRRASRSLVDDIHRVVLPIRPGDTDPHRQPPPEPELALPFQLPVEDERPPLDPEVAPFLLRHAVHVDLERSRDIGRKADAGSSGRWLGHVHRMAGGACAPGSGRSPAARRSARTGRPRATTADSPP